MNNRKNRKKDKPQPLETLMEENAALFQYCPLQPLCSRCAGMLEKTPATYRTLQTFVTYGVYEEPI